MTRRSAMLALGNALTLAMVGLVGACTGVPIAAGTASPPIARIAWPKEQPPGYLPPGAVDVVPVIAPAPVRGDGRYNDDRRIFLETRKLRNTPRWILAKNDVETAPVALMRDFSCATGKALTPENNPRLQHLMLRLLVDAKTVNDVAKHHFRRQRPFQIDSGAVCQPASELKSFDYPSGHAVGGWSWAYVLTELIPARANEILARGRAYAQSRVVCGAHNASAVDAGATVAAMAVAAVHGSEEFRRDIEDVRAELAMAPDLGAAQAQNCEVDNEIFAQPLSGR